MKNLFLAVIVAVTVVGGVKAVNLMKHSDHQHSVDSGFRCFFCRGSGFNGNFNCIHCNGTGRDATY